MKLLVHRYWYVLCTTSGLSQISSPVLIDARFDAIRSDTIMLGFSRKSRCYFLNFLSGQDFDFFQPIFNSGRLSQYRSVFGLVFRPEKSLPCTISTFEQIISTKETIYYLESKKKIDGLWMSVVVNKSYHYYYLNSFLTKSKLISICQNIISTFENALFLFRLYLITRFVSFRNTKWHSSVSMKPTWICVIYNKWAWCSTIPMIRYNIFWWFRLWFHQTFPSASSAIECKSKTLVLNIENVWWDVKLHLLDDLNLRLISSFSV